MTKTRRFPNEPESVPAARRFTTDALRGVAADVLDSVELMVSELATNCVRHASTQFDLKVSRQCGTIRVEVTDHAGGTPEMRSPRPDEPTGRGLQIVNMFSESWGVDHQSSVGKTVWFTIATGSSEPASVAGC
jgi:anti-sigma regulatory factor (Ser/Thr protein kinase)